MSDDDAANADRSGDELRKRMIEANADAEKEQPKPDDSQTNDSEKGGDTGAQAKNESGVAGTPNTQQVNNRYAVQGPKDNTDTHLARTAQLQQASQYGIIGLISTLSSDPNAPTAPWGRDDASGSDDKSALGNLFGENIGEAAGNGGLGLSGLGEGGGGHGEGMGLSNIGGLGNGIGVGPGGVGVGRSHGGPPHKVGAPIMREGTPGVNGRLPGEVIQRIVRQHDGQFTLCYQNGLRSNPSLTGRVSVSFAIDKSGAVSYAADGGSDLPDQGVVQCVVAGFRTLAFPKPDGGTVTVSYPIVFSPGE
jgi:hypothetical protein